jgi:hypothetical protein
MSFYQERCPLLWHIKKGKHEFHRRVDEPQEFEFMLEIAARFVFSILSKRYSV